MERTDIEQWKGREVARLLALVETERRYYQEIVATLPVALAVLSSESIIVSANRAFRDTFGLRPDEIRRRNIEHILPSPELLEKIAEARQYVTPQPSFFMEMETRLFRVSIIPLRNWDDDTEVEALLMVSDVTEVPAEHLSRVSEKERIEKERIEKAELEKEAAEQAAEVVPENEPVRQDLESSSDLEDSNDLEESRPDEIEIEEVSEIEISIIDANLPDANLPETEPSDSSSVPSAAAESAPPAPFAPAPFPTENLPAVLWMADAATLAFTHVSESAAQMFGYPSEHWTSSPEFFTERIHANDRDTTIALFRAAIEHGHEVSAEFRAHTAAGDLVWCRETIRPAGPGIIAGILTRVGPRKQMEQQRVTAERHAALQTLSAQLAHDLNNPLMIITGYAEEMLHGTDPADPRRSDLEQIVAATQRIAGITNLLLNFTRHPETPREPLNLAHVIASLKPNIEHAVGGPDSVYLNTPEPVWASANRARLEEIILALIAAVHEPPSGRVAISGDTALINEHLEAAILPAGSYARITVRNDGSGVDPAKRAAVFESILGKDRTAIGSETGAALAQAYTTIHSWGGDIAFSSDAAQGSVFTLLLPLADAPPAVAIPEPTPAVVAAAPDMPRELILVVDDEPGIRALVAKILRRERYQVLEAGSATEAIGVASAHHSPIQLLLTDVMLPDRSGRQVAEELRNAHPDLKILYISGFTDDESVRAGNFPPGSRFLQKPFTVGALVHKVREALDE